VVIGVVLDGIIGMAPAREEDVSDSDETSKDSEDRLACTDNRDVEQEEEEEGRAVDVDDVEIDVDDVDLDADDVDLDAGDVDLDAEEEEEVETDSAGG